MTFNIIARFSLKRGFPGSAADKESAYNTGDLSLIPESGRSPGEGIGYPLQNYCASLVAQLIKNSPAMQETWVKYLGWENPLEKGTVTHSSILAWRISWTIPWGRKELDMIEQLSHFHTFIKIHMMRDFNLMHVRSSIDNFSYKKNGICFVSFYDR